jgi:hypothetical protein
MLNEQANKRLRGENFRHHLYILAQRFVVKIATINLHAPSHRAAEGL